MAAFTSYFLWGVLPVFWKQLDGVSPLELTLHRMVWTFLAVLCFQMLSGRASDMRAAFRDPANRRAHIINSGFLATNWGIYVWAVSNGRIIEASLGYFLVPLLNVLMGQIIFKEVLSRLQRWAVGFAAAGVTVLVIQVHTMPWVALGLAGSWALYGLGRKRSHTSALNGLLLETGFATPIALTGIVWLAGSEPSGFVHAGSRTTLLMMSTGIVSMVPLVLFGYGARRLRFTTLGLLQYVAPTCQLLIGWLIYREAFTADRAGAFTLIWCGLGCYAYDSVRTERAARLAKISSPGPSGVWP